MCLALSSLLHDFIVSVIWVSERGGWGENNIMALPTFQEIAYYTDLGI